MPEPAAVKKSEVGFRKIFSATQLTHNQSIFDQTHSNSFGAVSVFGLTVATDAINSKASQLGGLPGNPISNVEVLPDGYVRRFDGADIYFSEETGAHEVHGDIRAKYNALQGPIGLLGLPTTDETGTPDGSGRFNHFQSGSIYWTPNTGPMMVRGAIRDLWGQQGFERGPLGYPVIDQYRFRQVSPNTDPVVLWNLFQNGAIVSTSDGTAVALSADVSPERLRLLVRKQFDVAFHKSPDNIGLQPEVETIAVSDWHFGFWASQPRLITFRLHGFHDNGLLLPDTDFHIDAQLGFGLTWEQTFTEPQTKTVVVELHDLSVTANGLGSGSVANGVANGVKDAFKDPVPLVDIPIGRPIPNFIDLEVTLDGGLSILVNPNPEDAGSLRQLVAQRQIDALIDG